MKQSNVFLILFLFTTLTNIPAFSQFYAGAGAGFAMPFGKFEETNKSATTYLINLENRYYCKFWYGLKIEYSSFDSTSNLPATTPFYKDMVNITPQIRYNFLGLNCYQDAAFPYLQLGLSISSIGRSDNSGRLGLGGLVGGGFSYGFTVFNTCMMLDANASYNMPNIILKDSARANIEFLHLNLTLNVKL
jgi:hypothetical protein